MSLVRRDELGCWIALIDSHRHQIRSSSRARTRMLLQSGRLVSRAHPSLIGSLWPRSFARGFSSSPVELIAIQYPQLSPTMTSGVITRWAVKAPSAIAQYDIIFETTTRSLLADESAPLSMEIESQDAGYLAAVLTPKQADGEVQVGTLLAYMFEDENTFAAHKDKLAECEAAVRSGNSDERYKVRPLLWQAYKRE